MDERELIPHLFRTEYSKITAVLCRLFGFEQIETAEDIASDTFLSASELWGLKGLPEHPVAWLYTVAKNKAKNYLKHQAVFQQKITPQLKHQPTGTDIPEIDLSPQNIHDSQLQMIFAICHPAITAEAQIGLALRILCGFGINEIADAFLTNRETIAKRLQRAKDKLRTADVALIFPPPSEIDKRLETVLKTLYLLFNEGYYSSSHDNTLRKELCFEAMRLTKLLLDNPATNQPAVNALLALMSFHASRFDARIDNAGEIVLYADQDPNLWNHALIQQGEHFLNIASEGDKLSRYHLEAGIAWWHTIKADTKEKWECILQLYNHLLQLEYSPMAALNRTYALSKANGKEEAIAAAEKLALDHLHLYQLLMGELYQELSPAKARAHFEKALQLAASAADKKIIEARLRGCTD
ncbi:RNA polymerase sigma-70 factor (ECF subfamily) [Chitinophaga polysaccharea]|uniref:RNA polymerase sigma-70 factor (ECF subfamily) n=1 Tax=Chitinophaga polysaccharea TaxID=1293035 RepID=A0A561PRH9_9BACT|nr:DUF6596 domain-containing protein [Chitinophaga polysaccharea]TWF40719.1 RNA polymerase sigma-70 factor (ECF subfamily) [Chitinophaga polysaccharea]